MHLIAFNDSYGSLRVGKVYKDYNNIKFIYNDVNVKAFTLSLSTYQQSKLANNQTIIINKNSKASNYINKLFKRIPVYTHIK